MPDHCRECPLLSDRRSARLFVPRHVGGGGYAAIRGDNCCLDGGDGGNVCTLCRFSE